jgi:4-amino-4-deoxy-L-arabinose transferase-like glycosyltransferase
LLAGIGLVLCALARLGPGLGGEPSFVDEWAYVSQSWYGPLWWGGEWNDPAWLDYAGVDLPPLPKYLIAAALMSDGRPLPSRMATREWYANTSSRSGDADYLAVARRPTVVLGVLGVLAVHCLGVAVHGWKAGALAGLLLLANPLYTLHARRAMSDVPTEALILGCAAVGLVAWKGIIRGPRPGRSALLMAGGAGVLGGLAVGSKLSGGLGLMILGGWALLGVVLPGVGRGRKMLLGASWVVAAIVGFLTFALINPVLFTDPGRRGGPAWDTFGMLDSGPIGRAVGLMRFRVEVSRSGQVTFPNDALETLGEKLPVILVQGFGRFGPFGPARSDSTQRFDRAQDWGAGVWLPLVGLALMVVLRLGRRQWRSGEAPVGWALAVQGAVTAVVVTLFIPLAWDRYTLSLQPVAALIVGVGVVTVVEWGIGWAGAKAGVAAVPRPPSGASGRPSSS